MMGERNLLRVRIERRGGRGSHLHHLRRMGKGMLLLVVMCMVVVVDGGRVVGEGRQRLVDCGVRRAGHCPVKALPRDRSKEHVILWTIGGGFCAAQRLKGGLRTVEEATLISKTGAFLVEQTKRIRNGPLLARSNMHVRAVGEATPRRTVLKKVVADHSLVAKGFQHLRSANVLRIPNLRGIRAGNDRVHLWVFWNGGGSETFFPIRLWKENVNATCVRGRINKEKNGEKMCWLKAR